MTNELNKAPPSAEGIIAMAERINRLQSSNRELLEALDKLLEFVSSTEEAKHWNTFSTPECVVTALFVVTKAKEGAA